MTETAFAHNSRLQGGTSTTGRVPAGGAAVHSISSDLNVREHQ